MRQVRGLSILTSLLSSLLRPGIADIYQLRVSVCMALKAVVEGGGGGGEWCRYASPSSAPPPTQTHCLVEPPPSPPCFTLPACVSALPCAGNPANRLLAREQGMLPPLMDLLRVALGVKSPPGQAVGGGKTTPVTSASTTSGQPRKGAAVAGRRSSGGGDRAAGGGGGGGLVPGEAGLLDAEEQVDTCTDLIRCCTKVPAVRIWAMYRPGTDLIFDSFLLQVAVAAMDTLTACLPDSVGNQVGDGCCGCGQHWAFGAQGRRSGA